MTDEEFQRELAKIRSEIDEIRLMPDWMTRLSVFGAILAFFFASWEAPWWAFIGSVLFLVPGTIWVIWDVFR